MSTSAAAAATVVVADLGAIPSDISRAERQRLFALRFRTDVCRTHLTTGECKYRDRCMFAHGPDELRTVDQNEADLLHSDKAIRIWIRMRRLEGEEEVARLATLDEEMAARNELPPLAPMTVVTKQLPQHDSDNDDDDDDDSENDDFGNYFPSAVAIAGSEVDEDDDEEEDLDNYNFATPGPSFEVKEDIPLELEPPTAVVVAAAVPPPLGPVVFQYRYNPYSTLRVKVLRGR